MPKKSNSEAQKEWNTWIDNVYLHPIDRYGWGRQDQIEIQKAATIAGILKDKKNFIRHYGFDPTVEGLGQYHADQCHAFLPPPVMEVSTVSV